MGLDLYIEKRIYIGGQYPIRKVTGTIDLYQDRRKLNIELNRLDSVIETVYHGERAWWLYDWFVNTINCPIDNSSCVFVDCEDLRNLHDSCSEIIDCKDKGDWKNMFHAKLRMMPPEDADGHFLSELAELRDSLANITEDADADYSVVVSY